MKLFLIHTGYYDKNIGDGFYEQHSNIFITAKDAFSAREKVKKNKEYMTKKMHIDGIREVDVVDDYKVVLQKENIRKNNACKEFSYDDVKKM